MTARSLERIYAWSKVEEWLVWKKCSLTSEISEVSFGADGCRISGLGRLMAMLVIFYLGIVGLAAMVLVLLYFCLGTS